MLHIFVLGKIKYLYDNLCKACQWIIAVKVAKLNKTKWLARGAVTGATYFMGLQFARSAAKFVLKDAADPCRISGSRAFRSTFLPVKAARLSTRHRPLASPATDRRAFQPCEIRGALAKEWNKINDPIFG